jgi:hypothetical protein
MKKKKTPAKKPLDYQTAKFLWAVAQFVPNNPNILKEARRFAQIEPIQNWHMDAIMFIESYEDTHGKLKRPKQLPPELIGQMIFISENISFCLSADAVANNRN